MSTPIPNPLDRFPAVRSALYLVQWVVTGIQTVISAFLAFAEGDPRDWPMWFLASLAVAPVLWSYLGVTAQSNVWNPPDPGTPHTAAEHDDTGAGELDTAVKLAVLVLAIIVIVLVLGRLL